MLRTLAILFLLLAFPAWGQTPQRAHYALELLSMIRSDSTRGYNDIQAAILATPIGKVEWPPLLSLRIGVRINDQDSITYIDIENHQPQKVRFTIYDRTVVEKNPKLYARNKAKLDRIEKDDLLILWFEFRDISEEPIRNMAITYGFWQGKNGEERFEETFTMEFTE